MDRLDWEAAPEGDSAHLRVYFADTDHMGVVYNGKYLTWMEIGRTELMRERGLRYSEVEERGISLPVTEASMRIRIPARYDDWIRIESRVGEIRTREVSFLYRIYREDELLVEGVTRHVPVAKGSGRSTRLPEWLLEMLRQ